MASELVIVYHRQPYEEVEENGKIVFRREQEPQWHRADAQGLFSGG